MNQINNNLEDNHQLLTLASTSSKNKNNLIERTENNLDSNIILKGETIKNQTKKNISLPKRNFSNLVINTNTNLFNTKMKKMKSNNKIKLRNDLFSEKLFSKTYRANKEIEKFDRMGNKKRNFSKKIESMKLPYLGDKIIFNRGETEKLLNYQFYTTSYRACCQISQYNNIPNSSMKANYKNNWDVVRNYVKEKRDDETRNKKYLRNKIEL